MRQANACVTAAASRHIASAQTDSNLPSPARTGTISRSGAERRITLRRRDARLPTPSALPNWSRTSAPAPREVAKQLQTTTRVFECTQYRVSFVVMPTAKKSVPTRVVNLRLRELDLKRIDAIAKREGRARANLLQSWVLEALKNARSPK